MTPPARTRRAVRSVRRPRRRPCRDRRELRRPAPLRAHRRWLAHRAPAPGRTTPPRHRGGARPAAFLHATAARRWGSPRPPCRGRPGCALGRARSPDAARRIKVRSPLERARARPAARRRRAPVEDRQRALAALLTAARVPRRPGTRPRYRASAHARRAGRRAPDVDDAALAGRDRAPQHGLAWSACQRAPGALRGKRNRPADCRAEMALDHRQRRLDRAVPPRRSRHAQRLANRTRAVACAARRRRATTGSARRTSTWRRNALALERIPPRRAAARVAGARGDAGRSHRASRSAADPRRSAAEKSIRPSRCGPAKALLSDATDRARLALGIGRAAGEHQIA